MEKEYFIKKIGQASMDLYKEYQILPSLTIAQACIESRFGTCALSPHFNFFGMKWTRSCGTKKVDFKTKEQNADGTYKTITASFRAFDNFEEGIKGYYEFITGYKRYANLVGEKDAYTACVKIRKDGWATSLKYTETLWDCIQKYDLTQYDKIVLGLSEPKEEVSNNKVTVYTVKAGDSLWSISRRFYGFGNKWRRIYNANKLNTTVIRVGQKLDIPKGGY